MNILFVCTGNTCRSPMAEALFREKTKGLAVEVRSAGVAAADGMSASENTCRVLEERGVPHSHQSKRLDDALIKWADLVLTMTAAHKRLVRERFPEANSKVFTLKEYVGCEENHDIADPFGGDLDIYRMCADEIDRALERLRHMVIQQLPPA